MPSAARPTRRIVAVLERGQWVDWRGHWRPPASDFPDEPQAPPPGGLVQVQFDASGYGTSDDEMVRLCDALAKRWPDCVCEVLVESCGE